MTRTGFVRSVIGGAALMGMSFVLTHAGVVPILGQLVALLSPDVFLIGLALVAFGAARLMTPKPLVATAFAAGLVVLAGLNTRLPSLASDLLSGHVQTVQIATPLNSSVGQPIHLQTDSRFLSARVDPFDHARPACRGDACLGFRGFNTPLPGILRDYWREDVKGEVLGAGFTIAGPEEAAPTLVVNQTTAGTSSRIRLTLMDERGQVMAIFDGRYRLGFPLETKDGVLVSAFSPRLAAEYLLHGNSLNGIAVRALETAVGMPLRRFLGAAARLEHPQGSSYAYRFGEPPKWHEPADTAVQLEVIETEDFEPALVFGTSPSETQRQDWTAVSYDKERSDRCKELLVPETKGWTTASTWHLVANDSTGRKKVRYTFNSLCEERALWFIEQGSGRPRITITKYSSAGDFIYRAGFARPPAPEGFKGIVVTPTFHASAGHLYFDWWDIRQSGSQILVKRSTKVRFREPGSNP